MPPISLTGIKPTGNPHIGNYFGMYRSALALTQKYLGMYFVADLHALTTTPDRKELQGLIYEVAASWIALGLDVEKSIFSDLLRVRSRYPPARRVVTHDRTRT